MTLPSDTSVLDAIDLGVSQPSTDMTVYFAKDGERLDVVTNQGDWSKYERAQVMAALDAYASVADLSFSVTTSPEDATFRLTKTGSIPGASLGFMNPPDPAYGDTQGIAWFNSDPYWSGRRGGMLDPGSYTYTIFLHEFGHGLGLAHPHDGTIMPQVGDGLGLDQGVYTVMTYNDGWPEAPEGELESRAWGWNLGPSALDIALVQEKYGANTETGKGRSTYVLPDENGAGTGYLSIWDVGGRDTIRHDGAGSATIDLRAATLLPEIGGGGWVSHVDGIHGGFTIANGVVIERAIGGSGRDTLIGNAADNILNGRGGRDRMEGGAGDDTYVIQHARDKVIETRGSGTDTVTSNRVDIDLGTFAHVEIAELQGKRDLDATGTRGSDVLEGNRGDNRLAAGRGHDDLSGGAGNDRLLGHRGNDALDGGRGRDVMTGGAGADTFVIKPGYGRDRITDFDARDILDLRAFGLSSFDDIAMGTDGATVQLNLDGALVLIELAGGTVTEDTVLI